MDKREMSRANLEKSQNMALLNTQQEVFFLIFFSGHSCLSRGH